MLDLYRKRMGNYGTHMGDALKKQSDLIMDKTFKNDIAYRICYIDGEPVDAKYLVNTYYSISKDAVDYHILFRPGVHYPIGKYIDIPDDVGEYHRWLILNRSDEPQFPKYNVLKCNWTFRWITNGVIHEQLGVLRMRNSYNSGLWHDYMATTPENQRQFIVPTNEVTQTIDYNMRFLISENQQNPIAWEVSKIEDTFPSGVIFITLKQDLFNPKTDNKELMIADYYSDPVIPDTNPDIVKRKIEYSGHAEVKVGGGFKIFSYSGKKDIHWVISGLEENQYQMEEIPSSVKIKVIRDYNLIGKTFTLSALDNSTNKVIESVEIGVVSL